MENPLLHPSLLEFKVDFTAIKDTHFGPALERLMAAARAEQEFVATQAPLTYEALLDYTPHTEQLGAVMGLLSHLASVVETPELRRLDQEYSPRVAQLFQEQGLDERVYRKVKALQQSPEFAALPALRQTIVNNTVRDYERSGIQLPAQAKSRLAAISGRLAELSSLYESNLTDFTDKAVLHFPVEALSGVPQRTLDNLPKGDDGRLEVTLVSGAFSDVLKHCTVEATRRAVYEATLGKGLQAPWDNRPVLREIAELEHERASLLGYASHAHYAIEDNMAETPAKALEFATNLAVLSLPRARQDAAELVEFGTQLLGRTPEFHDQSFLRERQRQAAYSTNSEVVRQYFPVKHVVAGLFRVLEGLYGLKFEAANDVSVWHPDVTAYRVRDLRRQADLGLVYLDLFKRKNKQSGAWMNGIVTRHRSAAVLRLPVTFLVCNAPKDLGQEPTFEFGEVVTLFHEMGHTLHNQLSEVDEEYFSGLNEVQHDAIELPSQFLENFCWDYSIVKELSAHVQTGEPLPEHEFRNLLAARQYMAAESLLWGARYSLMDLQVYAQPGCDPLAVEAEVLERWRTNARDERVCLMADFPHIFGGGYAAGYYAYQWAEMLSSDGFAALREEGESYLEQAQAAERFRQHVLASGGVQSMAVNFRAFRGRDPKPDFLLADYGIELPKAA